MKRILCVLFLFCSLLLFFFAFRAVPGNAQSASTAAGRQPNFHNGRAPNPAPNAKNSDDEDEDCMSEDDPSDYPVGVTVDGAGNSVPLAISATPVSDLPDLVPGLVTSPTSHPKQVAPMYVDAYQKPGRLLYRF